MYKYHDEKITYVNFSKLICNHSSIKIYNFHTLLCDFSIQKHTHNIFLAGCTKNIIVLDDDLNFKYKIILDAPPLSIHVHCGFIILLNISKPRLDFYNEKGILIDTELIGFCGRFHHIDYSIEIVDNCINISDFKFSLNLEKYKHLYVKK